LFTHRVIDQTITACKRVRELFHGVVIGVVAVKTFVVTLAHTLSIVFIPMFLEYFTELLFAKQPHAK
jgi:hypothetical protein